MFSCIDTYSANSQAKSQPLLLINYSGPMYDAILAIAHHGSNPYHSLWVTITIKEHFQITQLIFLTYRFRDIPRPAGCGISPLKFEMAP